MKQRSASEPLRVAGSRPRLTAAQLQLLSRLIALGGGGQEEFYTNFIAGRKNSILWIVNVMTCVSSDQRVPAAEAGGGGQPRQPPRHHRAHHRPQPRPRLLPPSRRVRHSRPRQLRNVHE